MPVPDPAYDPVVLDLVTGEFDETADYITVRAKGCRSWLVILTTGGSGRFRNERGEFTTATSDLTLLAPNRMHFYGTHGSSWQLKWAHFHPKPEWKQFLNWPEIGPGMATITLTDDIMIRVSAAMSSCHRIAASDDPIDRELAMAHLGVALLEGFRATGSDRQMDDARVRAAAEWIRLNHYRVESLEQVASQVGLSESRLSHLFRAETGETPWTYLERVRMDEARRLLAATTIPIGRIAQRVGFASEFYFSRRFRERIGSSPRDYRRAMSGRV